MTWALDPENRPQFSDLLKAFERLPKKRLRRTTSRPTYLTRSADALLIWNIFWGDMNNQGKWLERGAVFESFFLLEK